MEGGSDTTAYTLLAFVLAMAKYPKVLAKAQEEVDQACGLDRTPGIKDFENLPYVKACVSEVRVYNFCMEKRLNVVVKGSQVAPSSTRRATPRGHSR